MAETEQFKSKRERVGERLRNKYPDREYADDEAIFGQIDDDYDEYEKELGGYKERESKLTDMLTKDPHAAQFITDIAQNKDPWVSLINRIGIDGVKEMLEDPSKMEEYAASNRDYLERVAKSKELEQQWQENMQTTLQMLEQKQQEHGLSDEQLDAAADWLKEVANDVVIGVIKPETFEMALKAINHDADIEAAGLEGEIRGKNAKAEATLRKPVRSDGLPTLGGANNTPGAPMSERMPMSIFDEARAAK